jgi:Kef-type K+ transport system membrane component KefB/mannitol/fructose-specific phosphotransferase system IIA component (Ntr-type)
MNRWRQGLLLGAIAWPALSWASDMHATDVAPEMPHRMMVLVIQIGVILFAARLGNMLFEKLRLPGVLGELCVGVLIGPYLLGGVPLPGFKGFENGLFYLPAAIHSGSTPVSPELYGFCAVASVVLLFLVGLETDLRLFARYSLAGSAVGVGGVLFSFVSGDLLGVWLLPHIMEGSFNLLHPACIFLGVMSTATSVSITARIMSERKKLETPEGVTILAGAVIDDVLGIVMLAIGIGVIGVSSVAGGGIPWGAIGLIAGKSIGIWLLATVAGIALARRIGAGLKLIGGKVELSVMALGLALIVAGLFEEARLAMIIGSYVIGLSLSRTDISHVVRESLHPLLVFMVPVFFTVMGMMVDPSLFLSPKILLFGLIYSVSAVAAKVIGCGGPAMLCGFNARGALRIGLGMVPRGEVALIVAGIGLGSGLLSKEVFGVAVMMTLLTTMLAPPMLVWAFNRAGQGVRSSSRQPAAHPVTRYTFPSPEIAKLLLSDLLGALRREGFFVHALDMGEGLYQARKDQMVIGIRRQKGEIAFECRASEIPMVQIAMTEVVAGMEQTLNELRKPLDPQAVLSQPETAPAAGVSSRIAQYLHAELMIPGLRASNKTEAIAELMDRLVQRGLVSNRQKALDVVMRREEAMSTGLRHGLACPHGRTDQVSKLVCAVGLKPSGIPFDSLDGEPARIVILILSPDGAVVPYMEFMASLHVAFDEQGRCDLLKCRTAEEMCIVLANNRKGRGHSIG